MLSSDLRARVKSIFADAIEQPTGQRAAFVQQACGDDASLCAEVQRLIQLHDETVEPSTAVRHTPALPSESIGQSIGRYKLLQLIGEGGFGSVYMAEQIEPVRRQVALKIIKLGMDTKQVIARFEVERQALAMMDHPNIARVIDAGATETGRPYFVMDLVRGVPITEYCDTNKLDIDHRLKLFEDICSAVQHAHQKGIIHRDIKPSNVMVTSHDGKPVVKVIDFGIAKATHQRLTEKTLFTEYRQFIGTPAYMSPEQAEMSGLDIDTRTDIYSLGVLLYELLTGTTPFDPTRLRSAAYGEIQRIIREEEPPRPSTRVSTIGQTSIERTRLRRDLKGDLDWIVMKAMEKDRTRRYDTAGELADDIDRHLTNQPVEAGPPSSAYRLQKFVKRNRAAVFMAAAVVGSLLAGIVLMGVGFMRAERERKSAVEAREQATSQKLKAEQVAKFLKDMLATVGPMRAQGRDTTLLRAILDITLQRVGTELQDQPEVRAELLAVIGTTYRELALYEQAEKVIREALDLRRTHLGRDNPLTLQSLGDLANVLLDQGKLSEAEPIVEDVIERRKSLRGADDMSVAQAMNDLSYICQVQGRYGDAEAVQREVLRIVRKNVKIDHSDLAAALNQMARILNSNDKPEQAESFAVEGLEMRRRLFGDDHSDTALSLETVAYAQQARGDFAQAEQTIRRIVEIRQRVFGNDHPDTQNALSNLGWILARQEKYAQAEPIFRETLAVSERTFGNDYPGTLTGMSNLGGVLIGLGRMDEARSLFEAALEGRRRVLGPNHPDTMDMQARLERLIAQMPPPATAPVPLGSRPASE